MAQPSPRTKTPETISGPSISVGAPVRFKYGIRLVNGRVIEDRGPIGVGGRRLYSVQFGLDLDDPQVVELPESEVELAEP